MNTHTLPLDAQRFLFQLRAFLPRIGQAAAVESLRVELQSDTECTILIGDSGIGVDTGFAVPVRLIGDRHLERPGLRVFTLQTEYGGRWHPDEEVDKTESLTESPGEALVCVAGLFARLETNGLPDLPTELMPAATVLEEAW